MIFDTHAHYDDKRFDNDRDELLRYRLGEAGIGRIVNVSSDLSSLDASNDLSLNYSNVYAALGLHPSEIKDFSYEICLRIIEMAEKNDKVRAIGEIGLDYHYGTDDIAWQKTCFGEQIKTAEKLNLPIVVHSRDAARDTLDVIREYYTGRKGRINGVIHCFSYSYEEALRYIDLGFLIGVGGVVTYKNGRKLKEVVYNIPLEKIVVETDCPYLSPEPHRGKRNSSLYIPYILQTIADIKGVTEEEVERITYNTACTLFGVS